MTKCGRCGAQYQIGPVTGLRHTALILDGVTTRCQVGLDKFCEANGCMTVIYNWQMFCATHQGGKEDTLYGEWMGGIARQGEPDPASYGLS